MIEAVLFDLDGTLINTNDLIIKSFQYTTESVLQRKISKEEIVTYFGEPLITSLRKIDIERSEELAVTYKKYNEANHDKLAKSIDGVKETLEILKSKGIKLAVVTSKRKSMAEQGLKLFDLLDFIDFVITPENTAKHKPDGEPAKEACRLLNVEPHKAMMVGDSNLDILCGKNAGCLTCYVSYSALPEETVEKCSPDYIVDNLLELNDIIFHEERIAK